MLKFSILSGTTEVRRITTEILNSTNGEFQKNKDAY